MDGTLAKYDHWRGETHIGAPIPLMVRRVHAWLAAGEGVRIFTARVCKADGRDVSVVRAAIEDWCQRHIGVVLPVTNEKDYEMIDLWDDRAVQVEPNTGRRMDGEAG